jgi:serine phosphatase RsbU (regulator of sigma subunit)
LEVVAANRARSSREIVDAIFAALHDFSADAPTHDDMTAVALKITV